MAPHPPSSPRAGACPNCGAALPEQAPQGLCPKCLFAGLAEPTDGSAGDSPLPPPSPVELAPYFPQLEILDCLGRGGMGIVYRARQKSLNRFVALKLLAPERVADAKFAERFSHEAQALAKLSHPNIVTIHDFGQAGGFYYLLMEFVDGVNLRQAMKAGRFTPEQALAIVPPVCEALQYAHEHGIVHRDIKPENLLLDREGRVKIADFGVAKILGAESSGVGLSESQPAGTPQYMAPEQKEHRVTDHRADIYSLGVVLYEMLTGELPADKLQPPSKRVQVDIRIDEIVLRALEVEPELRFATAAEFRTQVEAVAADSETSMSPDALAETPESPRISRFAVIGACWVPVALAAGVAAYLVLRVPRDGVGPLWWQAGVLLPLLIIAVAGPFGTTILGWLAVAEIGRSRGKVQGLRLALFDGLAFPLAVLGAVIALASVVLGKMLVDFYANPTFIGRPGIPLITRTANWISLNNEVAVFVGVATAIVVNAFIVRAVMRAMHNTAAAAAAPDLRATRNQIRLASLALIFALMSAALGAFATMRSAGAWPAMELTFGFAGVTIFMALPVRRLGTGKSALIIAALGMVIWPLAALVVRQANTAAHTDILGPEIERVDVASDRATVKARGSHDAGMIFLFGTAANRWTPGGLYLDAMFDVSLGWGGFERGARWNIKPRRGIHGRYRLDGPPGSLLGKIAFHPGTPTPDADGSYVIGEFRPDKGEPLPIAVRFDKEKQPISFPTGEHVSRNHFSVVATYNQPATTLHYVLFCEGDFAGITSSGSQNVATNTWVDEGSVKLKNGRTFGYRREALYPDELHINGTAYDLRKGRVIVLRDDGRAEQFRFFPSVATARDPEAVSHLIRYEEAAPEKKGVTKNSDANAIPDHIDFKVTRVENPPESSVISLLFERDKNYGLGLEFSQDVIAAPDGKTPKPGYRDFRERTFVGVNDGGGFAWKLPEEFTGEEARIVAKEVEATAQKYPHLPDGALIEFARAKHREGWTYVLLARVRREAGAPHPPAPDGATYTIELGVFTAADRVIRLQLMMVTNEGPQQAIGAPLIFKTARDSMPGFLLRLHAYDGGENASRVLVDLVDGKSGVILHRFEHGFGTGVKFRMIRAMPLPNKNPPVMLVSPESTSATEELIGAEKTVPPSAASTERWLLLAKIEDTSRDQTRPAPLFEIPSAKSAHPPVSPPPPTNETRTFLLQHQLARNMEVALRQVFRGPSDCHAKAANDDRTIVVTAPSEVMIRARTFIAVNDAPDTLTREEPHGYAQFAPLVTVRSFLHACAIEDSDDAIASLLSVGVLAELRGERTPEYEAFLKTGLADPKWEASLRGDWPERHSALRMLVREWNRHPLQGITNAYEERATPPPAVAAVFAGVPVNVSYIHVPPASSAPDTAPRVIKGVPEHTFYIDSFPLWWPNPTTRRAMTKEEEEQSQARQFPQATKQ